VRAEHAIGAAVAAGDRRGDAADDLLVAQQLRSNEPGFGCEVLHDDRAPRCERVAGMRLPSGRDVGGPDHRGRPSDAGAQQHLGVARHQLQNLDQLDVEDVGDRGDHLFEEFLQVAFGQRPFAQPRDRLLLARTHADLAIDPQSLGHVPAQAEHLHGRAVLDDDGRRDLEPAFLASRRRGQAIFEAAWRERAHAFLDRRNDARLVLRMQVVGAERKRAVEAVVRTPVPAFEAGRPGHAAARDVPRQDAELAGFERRAKRVQPCG
jgi:hypothetical protein